MNEKALKQGDRVRVTLVGSVEEVTPVRVRVKTAGLAYYLDVDVLPDVVEKLADPEPEWVDGDYIQGGQTRVIRARGRWYSPQSLIEIKDREVSERWAEGVVTILHKADAA